MYSTEEWKRDNDINDDDLLTVYDADDNGGGSKEALRNPTVTLTLGETAKRGLSWLVRGATAGATFVTAMLMSHDAGDGSALWSQGDDTKLRELEYYESQGRLTGQQQEDLRKLRERLIGYTGSRALHSRNSDQFLLLHSERLITGSAGYQKISRLTDDELIRSVTNPANGDYVTVNTKTGKLFQGNTRIFELKRRNIVVKIPYQLYSPQDNNYFPDLY